MKKGFMTTILCVIVAVVIILIGVFFLKSLTKDDNKASDKQQTESSAGVPEIENTDTPGDEAGESFEPDAPVSNEVTDDKTSDSSSVSNEVTNAPSDTSSDTQSSEGSQGESTPPSQPSQPAQTVPETTPVTPSASMPTSYKEFSLTKGMDAAAAVAKLDDFLNSKYSILLNKQNKVADTYAPTDLITPSGCSYPMERVAGNALVSLMSAARQSGINDLVMYSGYRTVASQKNKYENRTNQYLQQGYSRAEAEAKAGQYIAPPGASEHHTGLAADVCSSSIVNKYGQLVDEFDQTASYRWMRDNCARFGFIIRYTKGDEGITGYSYEPWHMRYLGVEHATACTQLGITYEEYYSLITKFRNEAKAEAGA